MKFPHLPIRILTSYREALTGLGYAHRSPYLDSVMHPVHLTSSPYFYLKAIALEQLLLVQKTSRTHVPRTGEQMGSLLLTGFSSSISW